MSETRRSARGAIGPLAELVLIAAVATTLAPILWMLVLAFQPLKDIIGSGIKIDFSLSNFNDLLARATPCSPSWSTA